MLLWPAADARCASAAGAAGESCTRCTASASASSSIVFLMAGSFVGGFTSIFILLTVDASMGCGGLPACSIAGAAGQYTGEAKPTPPSCLRSSVTDSRTTVQGPAGM